MASLAFAFCWFLAACAKYWKIQFYQKTKYCTDWPVLQGGFKVSKHWVTFSINSSTYIFCCCHYYYNNNVAIITFLYFSICPSLLSFAINGFSRYWRKVLPFTQKDLFARTTLFSPLISPSLPLLLTLTFHLIPLPFSFPFFLFPSSRLKYFAYWKSCKSCKKWSAKLKYPKVRVADLKFLVTSWIFMKSDWTPEKVWQRNSRKIQGDMPRQMLGFSRQHAVEFSASDASLVPFTLKIQWIFRINFIF